ncbi:hypothetical protein HL667_23480 [Bradyrhizobium sp. 83012]|uniref:Sel1 repeat family protein n=1 Tax=Bradyrhizobium aeschynomenes TaxID=2734909 RepID=A0ABX2CID4_9BRAD|nr:hypothetical protein [Bradyrhizobium aeschynomenes]NPU67983.1 hypothetical protein [Bradyrhizobium aeschynomenes]NPV24144.1 hypothetical protein [Bradyrhizobium aeschynomenes]
MAERMTRGRFNDRSSTSPDFRPFPDEPPQERPPNYRFGRSVQDHYPADESMPMFLSEYDGGNQIESTEFEDQWPTRARRTSISSRILLAVVAAAGVAVLFALVTSDATRDLIASAKASIVGSAPDPTAPPQASGTELTARDMQLNEPARLAPEPPAAAAAPAQMAAVAPTRDDIANAYQTALQNRVPTPPAPAPAPSAAAVPPAMAPSSITSPGAGAAIVAPGLGAVTAAPPPSQARRLEPDELSGIMKRAKGLLAAGDIPSARLLLERAAEAQEPAAALMLAQTYDPHVLGTKDIRNINADPAAARNWYRRAAQLGSSEAQRRLDQLQN